MALKAKEKEKASELTLMPLMALMHASLVLCIVALGELPRAPTASHHTARALQHGSKKKEKIEKVPPCAKATVQSAATNSISSVMDVDVSPQTA